MIWISGISPLEVLEAGLGVVEITFRTAAAATVIATLASRRPNLLIGAGTLLTDANVKQAVEAGAKFGVAPGLNPRTVAAAQTAGGAPPVTVFPDQTPARVAADRDPREVFAEWLIRPENPWFTRAIANRLRMPEE